MADKDNSGVLFTVNEKTNERGPDRTGSLTLSADIVKELAALVKAGKPAKLSLSAWNNVGQTSGKPYLGLKTKVYVEKAKDDDGDGLFSK